MTSAVEAERVHPLVELEEAIEFCEACAELAPLYSRVRALEARALAAARRLVSEPDLYTSDESLITAAGQAALTRLAACEAASGD